jgi:hypothetical protein
MKKTFTYVLSGVLALVVFSAYAQQPEMQYFRPNDQTGLNVFETSKDTLPEFDGLKVRVGGAFAMQFQAIDHENNLDNLVNLTDNFNLPTANLDIDVQLYDGVRMHLRTYLSSRHHTETYVKGGYIQIDKLDFVRKDFLKGFMQHATIRIGQMENNYGDSHFRRTDNGQALHNPFVGNYIMDSFTTEIGGEVYYRAGGFLAMVGVTNGRLNQNVTDSATKAAFIGKLGYDKQMNENFRFRLTGSIYTVGETGNNYLYGGDRAGARYYEVMDIKGGTPNDFSGRINPGFKNKIMAIMINPFIKYRGLEFFGVYETSSGRNDVADAAFSDDRTWTQLAGELIYRFGAEENLFFGARYNVVTGNLAGQENDEVTVDRLNIGGGWFLTKNILTKIEYMTQTYKDYPAGQFEDGKFEGLVLEAVIAF